MIYFLIVLLLVGGFWSVLVEPYLIKVEKVEIEIDSLPFSFDKIKIVQISDLHLKKIGKRERKLLKKIEEISPDFIFITGDFIDWRSRNLNSLEGFWRELSFDREGKVFGIYGNHDHRNPEFKILKEILKRNKVRILDNESISLRRNNEFIYLLGVDDPHLGYDNIEKTTKDLEKKRVSILLAHSPEIFRKVKDKRINLVLTGHTHGGQIDIPFISNLILPLKYDKKYKRGLFKEEGKFLYVNRGIGTTVMPVRFNALPEITLFILKRKN